MSHFLAGVVAYNLILHIYVVVNWQLSKNGICWPVSHGQIGAQGRSIEVTRFFEVLHWQVTSSQLIAGSTPSGYFAMGSSLLLELNYKFINGSHLWTQPSLQGFSVAVPFLSISWFWRNLTEYRKHLPMVNAMVIKDKSRELSQSETETLYYNKLKLFLLWMS